MMTKPFLTLILLCLTVFVFAQTSKTSSTSTESTTVSINNSERDYSLVASFGQGKAASIKLLVIEALGKPEHAAQELVLWNLKDTYTIKLKPGKLILELDKDKATETLVKTFEQLGQQIQQLLGAPKTPSKP